MNKLLELLSRIGLTKDESKVLLFVTIIFLVGLAGNIWKYASNKQNLLEFDYSRQDSLFEAASVNNESADSSEIFVQKNIASKHELLDFSQHKKPTKLAEKPINKGSLINLNKATVQELVSLPGIGEKTAISIIEYRTRKGKFANINELLKIKGIAKARYEKIKSLVVLE